MGIKLITAPAALLTLAELRLHLKLDTTAGVHADDTLIAAQLQAAHRYAEHYTQASLGSQTLELALDEFPAGSLQLLRGPVTSVTSLKYIDTSQVEQTLSASLYTLDDYTNTPWISRAYDTDWPATLATVNAVKVRYVAGATLLDDAVRAALLLIVGHLYAHRQSVGPDNLAEVPQGANALLDTVRVWSV